MPAARWRSIEDLRPHLDPIVAELDRMPSLAELGARGRGDLIGAIHKFGGLRRVAEALRYLHKGRRSWDSIEDLRRYLDPLVAELGFMPTENELIDRGRVDLIGAIAKFGGVRDVAAALGYQHRYEGRRSWDSVEDLRPHLDALVAELRRMPTHPELTARKRSDLTNAIQKFGGFSKVAETHRYPYEGAKHWGSVEDLRPQLDPLVAELG